MLLYCFCLDKNTGAAALIYIKLGAVIFIQEHDAICMKYLYFNGLIFHPCFQNIVFTYGLKIF